MADLTITRGDTESFEIQVDNPNGTIFDLTDCDIWFTVKTSHVDADVAAIIQKHVGDGITVVNPTTGFARLLLSNVDTLLFTKVGSRYVYVWDLELVAADGSVRTLTKGTMRVNEDVTRRIV